MALFDNFASNGKIQLSSRSEIGADQLRVSQLHLAITTLRIEKIHQSRTASLYEKVTVSRTRRAWSLYFAL